MKEHEKDFYLSNFLSVLVGANRFSNDELVNLSNLPILIGSG